VAFRSGVDTTHASMPEHTLSPATRLREASVSSVITPYRSDESQVERLREENTRLRAQLEAMTDEPLLPHRTLRSACQKCGLKQASDDCGPTQVYEAAYVPSWWMRLIGRRAHPSRMRRHCQYCYAIYYERTKDQERT